MKKKLQPYFLVILFILSFSACSIRSSKKLETFEGYIEYSIQLTHGDNSMDDFYYDYLDQKFGNTTIHYFDKNGNFKREFPNSGDNGLEYYLYQSDSNALFAKWKNMDTLFYYIASEPLVNFIKESNGVGDTILGQATKFNSIQNFDPVGGKPILSTYYYSGKPYMNPELYNKMKDFHQDKAIEYAQSAFLKIHMDITYYTMTLIATKINPKKIDQSKFKIPKNTPLKLY